MPFIVPNADTYLREILQLLVDQEALDVPTAKANWPQFPPYANNLRELLGAVIYDNSARVINELTVPPPTPPEGTPG